MIKILKYFVDSFLEFVNLIVSVIVTLFNIIVQLIQMISRIPDYLAILNSMIQSLPPFVSTFVSLTLVISVLYFALGRKVDS